MKTPIAGKNTPHAPQDNIANVALPDEVQPPRYDRKALKSRIVHIGFGAFHRAHQALLTDRVLNRQGEDWGICGISLFGNENLFNSLRQQAHRYSVLEKRADANQLLVRYQNPSLKHRSWQIAMDGTQKLPQRMLDSIRRWHIDRRSDYRCLLLGVAGWMRYVGGIDDAGRAIDVRDPMAEQLQRIVSATEDDSPRVLALTAVFGDVLPQNETFVNRLIQAYASLQRLGAKAAVAALKRRNPCAPQSAFPVQA